MVLVDGGCATFRRFSTSLYRVRAEFPRAKVMGNAADENRVDTDPGRKRQ